MADSIALSCPECQKAINVSINLVGKRIRCKGCGHVFPVEQGPTSAKPGSEKAAKPKAASPAPAKPKAASPTPPKAANPVDDEWTDSSPYDARDIDETPRCPNCANEMESEDAIVCLFCGYNTVTRYSVGTTKTYETTRFEQFKWSAPGVLAVLAICAIIGGCVYYHFSLPYVIFDKGPSWADAEKDQEVDFNRSKTIAKLDVFSAYMFHFAIELWIFVFAAYLCWLCAKFAYGRLIKNPRPPEKIKRK
jgi:hypothetical protein